MPLEGAADTAVSQAPGSTAWLKTTEGAAALAQHRRCRWYADFSVEGRQAAPPSAVELRIRSLSQRCRNNYN